MSQIPICDYEESDYRTAFWEGRGRDYEDRVERAVLRKMLPPRGKRLLEIGAGFGRLTDEYGAYEQVVLLDYSFSQLQYARERLGDARTIFVAANVYKLPFRPGVFDGATMIRVLHHMVDAPAALEQIRRVLVDEAVFILEFANKRNLKAVLRYALRRQNWSPYTHDPVEFVALNFDFHPEYVAEKLRAAGFSTQKRVPVSFFRLGLLKRTLPAALLAQMDALAQMTGWLISPSVFTRNLAQGSSVNQLALQGDDLFICPESGGELRREGDLLISESGLKWAVRDGIYDFKAPVE